MTTTTKEDKERTYFYRLYLPRKKREKTPRNQFFKPNIRNKNEEATVYFKDLDMFVRQAGGRLSSSTVIEKVARKDGLLMLVEDKIARQSTPAKAGRDSLPDWSQPFAEG